MKRTTYQVPELRDENDNIIQQGAFGKNTALANATNDGWIDYVANDLMYLYNNTMGGTGGEINTETITGKTGTITNLTATTVKADTLTADALNGPLTGDVTGNLTGNVTGTADKAVADGDGNNIVNTYVTKSAVQGELTNYLPLSGGTVSGNLTVEGTITGNLAGNADTATNATNATNDANGNPIAGTYLPLAGGTMSGTIKWSGNNLNVIKRDNGNDGLVIIGGDTDNFSGATLQLFGQTNSSYAGRFYLRASTRSDVSDTSHPSVDLVGSPDGTLTWGGQPLLPVGIVQAFAGTTIPRGWLLCDGSAVRRTDYGALFAVIGTTYGAGNGSTTFNLPNLVDKFVEGSATSGTVKSAGLPNITGTFQTRYPWNGAAEAATGAFKSPPTTSEATTTQQGANDKVYYNTVSFNANKSNSVYGNSTTVQPPALTMRYIIKY